MQYRGWLLMSWLKKIWIKALFCIYIRTCVFAILAAQSVNAAYGCNLIRMNPTIKKNNHKFCPYYCISIRIELGGCQFKALDWLRKSGRESEWLMLCPACSATIRLPLSKVLNLQQSSKAAHWSAVYGTEKSNHACPTCFKVFLLKLSKKLWRYLVWGFFFSFFL